MKIAVVHYWWFKTRGGEKVLIELLKIYPYANLFLHCGDVKLITKELQKINFKGEIKFSYINKIPFISKIYKFIFFLMPSASENFNFDDYNLIISSESGPAKNIITPVDSIHICYCHSPMRYIWDFKNIYINKLGVIKKQFFQLISYYARKTDYLSAMRVDKFIANSSFIQRRIKKIYHLESTIIYPPVDINSFYLSNKKNYYLYFGELIEYKKPDIVIQAFNKLGSNIYIIGNGPMKKELQKNANKNIKFLDWQTDANIRKYLSEAQALIYPGIEDFGIIPVEAMASGTPVIAFKKGGILDSLDENICGIFFEEQNDLSLINAIIKFENKIKIFDSVKIKNYSQKFSSESFRVNFNKFIKKILIEHNKF